MQYLKDEVRNRIMTAALQEFKEKGYLDASMRKIASEAGVALGNVYRYFKNKEELFNELMEPVYILFMSELKKHMDNASAVYAIDALELVADQFIKILKEYSTQFLILVDKSQGTKFAHTREQLIEHIEEGLKNCLGPQLHSKGIIVQDEYIFHVMGSTFVEGVFSILRKYEDETQIRYLIRQLTVIYFYDITNRFK